MKFNIFKKRSITITDTYLNLFKNEVGKSDDSKSNIILSSGVSKSALIGHNIYISEGVYISKDSLIDSYTHIGFNTLITKATIGRYNSIASNVNIGHGEHPIDGISTNMLFYDSSYELLTLKDCVIENDVWIGVNATIRRGVTINNGAVIGANAFVNKDVPPFAVVAGVPARIIKYRFDQTMADAILASRWWDFDLDEAKDIVEHLYNK